MGDVVRLMQPQRQQALETLEALAESMLCQAKAGQWDAVIAVQPMFEESLRQMCAGNPGTAEASPLMLGLERLQGVVLHIEALAHSGHVELADHLQRFQRRRGAVQVYETMLMVQGGGEPER